MIIEPNLERTIYNSSEMKLVTDFIKDGLVTDGDHHKQWYLEKIAETLSIDICSHEHEKGISP